MGARLLACVVGPAELRSHWRRDHDRVLAHRCSGRVARAAVGWMDDKGAAMNRMSAFSKPVRHRRFAATSSLLLAFLLFASVPAEAHVGSPDIFFNGQVGPYPAQITI